MSDLKEMNEREMLSAILSQVNTIASKVTAMEDTINNKMVTKDDLKLVANRVGNVEQTVGYVVDNMTTKEELTHLADNISEHFYETGKVLQVIHDAIRVLSQKDVQQDNRLEEIAATKDGK